MKRIIVLVCMVTFLNCFIPVWAFTVKEGLDITILPNTLTSTEDIRDFSINAVIKEDVFYNGNKIFKAGDKALLMIQDYKPAGCWGIGGKLLVANGYAYDAKGNKRRISFSKNINGHDKNWVKGVCCAGLLLWPLLLFGFIKGEEAKLMNKDEIYAITMNSFEF